MPLNTLAGSTLVDTMAASPQLFAGEAPIITDSAPALATCKKWELLCLTPTGVRPFVWIAAGDAGNDDPRTAVIAAAPIDVTVGKQVPYYDAGKFNVEVVTFPAALSAPADRLTKLPAIKAAMHGSMLHFAHLTGLPLQRPGNGGTV